MKCGSLLFFVCGLQRADDGQRLLRVDQFEMAARESVWAEILAADPVGATRGTGVRRAPNLSTEGKGWNAQVAAKMRIPALFVAAANDISKGTVNGRAGGAWRLGY